MIDLETYVLIALIISCIIFILTIPYLIFRKLFGKKRKAHVSFQDFKITIAPKARREEELLSAIVVETDTISSKEAKDILKFRYGYSEENIYKQSGKVKKDKKVEERESLKDWTKLHN